jgi:hypothetical protein
MNASAAMDLGSPQTGPKNSDRLASLSKDHSSIVRRDPQRPCEIFRFCWKQQEARIFSKIFLLSSKKYEEGKINHWNLCAKMSLSDS